MKKLYKFIGTAFLGMAALFTVIGPASVSGVGVEELPKSIKNKR